MFAFDFDPSLPTVAVSEFSAGERRVHAGEAFDWRAHGMTEIEVIPLLRAGFLRQERPPALDSPGWHALEVNTTARRAVDEVEGSKLAHMRITPGERVTVTTPDQRRGKRR